MAEYGQGIVVGSRVELSPHLDLWMRGARFGTVQKIHNGRAYVKMDHRAVKKLAVVGKDDVKLS